MNYRTPVPRNHWSYAWPVLAALVVVLVVILGADAFGRGYCYIDQYGRRICVPANAQQSAIPQQGTPAVPHPSRCRIRVPAGRFIDYGTGTLIDNEQGIILTCNHIFADQTGPPVCTFPDGRRFTAVVIARDPPNDLAALRIKSPGIETMPIDTSEPTGSLTVGGFGGTGQFRASAGYVVGRSIAAGATGPGVEVSAGVSSGDSGGAAVDTQRRVRGVLWGESEDGRTHITCGQPLRAFLDRILPGRPGVVIPRATNYGSVGGQPGLVPVQPIPNQPTVEAPPTQPDPEPEIDYQAWENWQQEIKQEQASIRNELSNISVLVANLQGVPGERGPQGPKGDPGAPAVVDYEQLASEVQKRLPPVRIEWERLDGEILTQEKPLGQPLRLKTEKLGAK